jgi:filamentous hemagglutinin family protein
MPDKATTHLPTRKRLLAAAIASCFVSSPAWANPSGPQVVNGTASFNQAGSLLTVNNSNGAIINWNSFSIGANETTRFNQASATSSVLNRVVANDPSALLGTLNSNGKVWLVNPAGILVGQGAKIDVAGFVASTLNVANQDFLAGRLNFGATPNAGSVQNDGQITTPSGGNVYLIAPSVTNNGIIHAPNGEAILAAGQTVQLLDTSTPGVSVAITGAQGNVTNLGQIVSEAGQIGIAGVLVNNSGELNARSVVKEGGRIFLKASQRIEIGEAGRILADGTRGGHIVAKVEDGGQLSGKLLARGVISAQGNGKQGSGGYVETSAKTADINGAQVNTGGGTWLFDPDDVEINSTATISGATLVTPATIDSALANNNFVVQTDPAVSSGNGDIFLNCTVLNNKALWRHLQVISEVRHGKESGIAIRELCR